MRSRIEVVEGTGSTVIAPEGRVEDHQDHEEAHN